MSHADQTLTQFLAETNMVKDRLRSLHVPGETFEAIHEVAMDEHQKHFEAGAGPDGTAWPPRVDPTLKHPPLVYTGALIVAATGGANSVNTHDERTLTVGVTKANAGGLPGAAVHQDTRPYLGLGESAQQQIGELFADGCNPWEGG